MASDCSDLCVIPTCTTTAKTTPRNLRFRFLFLGKFLDEFPKPEMSDGMGMLVAFDERSRYVGYSASPQTTSDGVHSTTRLDKTRHETAMRCLQRLNVDESDRIREQKNRLHSKWKNCHWLESGECLNVTAVHLLSFINFFPILFIYLFIRECLKRTQRLLHRLTAPVVVVVVAVD